MYDDFVLPLLPMGMQVIGKKHIIRFSDELAVDKDIQKGVNAFKVQVLPGIINIQYCIIPYVQRFKLLGFIHIIGEKQIW